MDRDIVYVGTIFKQYAENAVMLIEVDKGKAKLVHFRGKKCGESLCDATLEVHYDKTYARPYVMERDVIEVLWSNYQNFHQQDFHSVFESQINIY